MSGRTGCNQTVSSAPLLRPHSLVLATLPCLLWPGPAILHTEKSHDYLQLWKHSTFPSRKVKGFPKISKIPQILPKIIKNAFWQIFKTKLDLRCYIVKLRIQGCR